MSDFQLLAPEETTNLVKNPTAEVATTGYAAWAGGTIARDSTYARRGLYSIKVTPPASSLRGICYTGCDALTAGLPYTFSADLHGTAGLSFYLSLSDGSTSFTPALYVMTGNWQRCWLTFTPLLSVVHTLIITRVGTSTDPFWTDGWQLEQKAYRTSYCDGSLEPYHGFLSGGCTWNGTAHASTSTRSSSSRMGGRLLDLEDDLYFKVRQALGLGAPPVEAYSSKYADPYVPGSLYAYTRETDRIITLTGLLQGTSKANLITRRNALIYYTRPKVTRDDEPFWLRWTAPAPSLEIPVHYNGGLEGGELQYLYETCAIRLIAPYPYWRSTDE